MTTDEAEYREKIRDDDKVAARCARERAEAPWTPEELIMHIEMAYASPCTRMVITTRYGNHELPVDEMWENAETKTLHLSVRLPEGYALIKTD